jgi:gamma-glutamylputrescine oxidase
MSSLKMKHPINSSLTWYDVTAGPRLPVDQLLSRCNVDCCVIGGGFTGLTTALELSRLGKSVVLLEADRVANGASGRNGGFVSNGFAESFDAIAKAVGKDAAKALYAMSRDGSEYVRRLISGLEPSIKAGDGWMVMQRFDDKGALRVYGEKLNAEVGESFAYHERSSLRDMVDSSRYLSGLFSATAFHIHPMRYANLLVTQINRFGGLVYECSPALAVERRGGSYEVRSAAGSVVAKDVVYCVSALDRSLHPSTGRAVMPIATYIAVTEPLQQNPIKTSAALSDTRRAGNYFRMLPDDRLLWGGHITTSQREPADLAPRMQADIISVFPQLGQVRIEYHWAGMMGYALHKMPLIGTDGAGQWHATAFGGHGLNTTAMAGNLVARAIARGDDSYRRFQAFAPRRAFGQLGRLGVQATYWLMQLKDRIDER